MVLFDSKQGINFPSRGNRIMMKNPFRAMKSLRFPPPATGTAACFAALVLLASGSLAHAALPDEEPASEAQFQMAPLSPEFLDWYSEAEVRTGAPLSREGTEESRANERVPQTPPEPINWSHLNGNPPADEGGELAKADLPSFYGLRDKKSEGALLPGSKIGFGTTAEVIASNITKLKDANIFGLVDEDNRDAAKLAIMQHGAVKVSYYSPDPDESSEYYCTYPQCAYYCPGSAS
ncbi:MAG: hypothetical protein IKH84_00930, partial [Ottowia sp.]|nr:hypothetical protein [Ottowia sp.]